MSYEKLLSDSYLDTKIMSYVVVKRENVKQLRDAMKKLQLLKERGKVLKLNDSERGLPLCTSLGSLEADRYGFLTINGSSYRIYNGLDLPSETTTKPYDKMRNALELHLRNKSLWNDELVKEIPKSWIKYGDMILFDSKSFVHPVWKEAGDLVWPAICASLKVKRLGRRYAIRPDGFRSPRVELLWGDDCWVSAIDGHISYSWDVTSCMFSPGNATERFRISKMDCMNETIVDLYAGIGYFTLPFLVHAKAAFVHACEWNPAAVRALRCNLEKNNVANKCCIHEGDNREVCPNNVADRVCMGLIPTCEPGIITACKALKSISGGILHLHENVSSYKKHSKNIQLLNSPLSSHEPSKAVSEFSHKSACEECATLIHSLPEGRKLNRETLEDETKVNVTTEFSASFYLQDKNCEPKWNTSSQIVWKKWEWFVQALHFSHKVCSFLSIYHCCPWKVEVLDVHHVKSYAPHIDHLVFDLKCSPIPTSVANFRVG